MKSMIMNLALGLFIFASTSYAAEEYPQVAIGGYDAVSYFKNDKPVRGSGMLVHRHEGQDYLFSTKENMVAFQASPDKYLPQYGGYCAFGAAVGKKFNADPNVFSIVNNKLYLNLDGDIQKKWNAKQMKMIKDADKNWTSIKATPASKL